MALELGSHNVMPLDFSSGTRENVSPMNISGSQPPSPPGSSAFTIVTPKEVSKSSSYRGIKIDFAKISLVAFLLFKF
ncbi:hypothetical protein HHI36_006538 [Cryptolaemus montrouzieri]|uniref:Uncharacterized protein n=1 Tax=Cryptolaemus montrouzieri TaxID=559131 RepID=A0ABD2NYF5_9CUCU